MQCNNNFRTNIFYGYRENNLIWYFFGNFLLIFYIRNTSTLKFTKQKLQYLQQKLSLLIISVYKNNLQTKSWKHYNSPWKNCNGSKYTTNYCNACIYHIGFLNHLFDSLFFYWVAHQIIHHHLHTALVCLLIHSWKILVVRDLVAKFVGL